MFIFRGKEFRVQREKVTIGLWHLVARKLTEFNFPSPPWKRKAGIRY